jgi:hypothetical protein
MISQIGDWIEFNFWQLAVHALSKARPLSSRATHVARALTATHSQVAKHSIEAQHSFEAHPLVRAMAGLKAGAAYAIAIGGWLLGLVLGLWLSSW